MAAIPLTLLPPEPSSTTPVPAARILIVDDEEGIRHFLGRGLRRLGYEVSSLDAGDKAIERWAVAPADVAVVDLRMPGCDGLTALARIRALDPEAAVVLMTGYGSVATAVEAMRLGAVDFVEKPFELEELVLRLERALEGRRRRASPAAGADPAHGIVGTSEGVQRLLRELPLLAGSMANVLVTGESGTGKGLVARAVHAASSRARGPFVTVPCAALPETLFESLVFGHESGAFTGARQSKQGLASRAEGGTLFLDEVAELSPAAQAKLAHFLQHREFTPLGGTASVRADVRIVAATNRDLGEVVRAGTFRADLLWRLDVVRLHLPPLRERCEDIPLLLAHHLQRIAAREQRPAKTLGPEAIFALTAYAWPGNVRELQNIVERMAVLAGPRADLGPADLPPEVRGPIPPPPGSSGYVVASAHFDRTYFTSLLAECHGNVSEAARQAGISRGHLHRRLRELGLDPEQHR